MKNQNQFQYCGLTMGTTTNEGSSHFNDESKTEVYRNSSGREAKASIYRNSSGINSGDIKTILEISRNLAFTVAQSWKLNFFRRVHSIENYFKGSVHDMASSQRPQWFGV
jgi:hypothetical protein